MLILGTQPVEIIGHRGASYAEPENTVAAAKLAWEEGADGIECDIHLTKDGKLAVIHDATIDRTTGIKGTVSEMTLAELQELSQKTWDDKEKGIPSLDEWLATGNGKFLIEIKCGPEALPELQNALKRSGKKPEQIFLISFSLETLRAAKEAMPEYAMYWIIGWKKDSPSPEEAIRDCKEAGLDGLDLDYHWPIDREFVAKMKDAGLGLYVWTVDDAGSGQSLAEAGVKGITTNRPGSLRQSLK